MIWIGPGLDLTIWCSKPMLALWSENLVADSEAENADPSLQQAGGGEAREVPYTFCHTGGGEYQKVLLSQLPLHSEATSLV